MVTTTFRFCKDMQQLTVSNAFTTGWWNIVFSLLYLIIYYKRVCYDFWASYKAYIYCYDLWRCICLFYRLQLYVHEQKHRQIFYFMALFGKCHRLLTWRPPVNYNERFLKLRPFFIWCFISVRDIGTHSTDVSVGVRLLSGETFLQ